MNLRRQRSNYQQLTEFGRVMWLRECGFSFDDIAERLGWNVSTSALVPVMTMCWSERSQGNACNQTVCGKDTLDLHQESWSGEQFPI
ncbi:hypothetical protein TNCV_4249461 [Trichonephila clavipes]|nr:hypothetical protein TNCV_4249461 [Trichonephila clavipes]